MAFNPGKVFDRDNPFGEPITRDQLDELETSSRFWDRTPQLQQIAWIAAQEDVSAWGLLLAVQHNRMSNIAPNVVLVKRSGNPGVSLSSGTSLNLFGGLVGISGGGKSTIFKESQDIIAPAMRPIPDGTGQGLVKSIADTEKVTRDDEGKPLKEPYYVTRFHHHSLVIHSPEVKKLNSEFSREGSQTDSMMRSLWSGETTGMTTSDRERRVTLPANMYRICGMWGIQPVNADAIMAGAEDGTPQRWVFAPADEWRGNGGYPAPKRTAPTGPVTFPMPVWNPGTTPYGMSGGQLPDVLADGDPLPDPIWVSRSASPKMDTWYWKQKAARDALLDRDQYAVLSPERAAEEASVLMNSHTVLTTIKQACAMAFLHGRCEPNDDDFELALVQMEISRGQAAGMWMRLTEKEDKDVARAAEWRGQEQHRAAQVREELGLAEVGEVAEKIWKKLTRNPYDYRSMQNSLSGRQRKLAKDAIHMLVADGRARQDRDGAYWAVRKGIILPMDISERFRE